MTDFRFEQNIIKDYFEESMGEGFDYAYTYPGMNKVLQAVGRVIRTENDRKAFVEKVMALKLNKTFIAEIKAKVKRRSLNQNKLYWLWLTAVEVETGNSRDYLHDIFKTRFLPKIKIDVLVDVFQKSL